MTDYEHDDNAQPTEESGAFDIICPECSGMLNDVVYENFTNLYCPVCDIEWRV